MATTVMKPCPNCRRPTPVTLPDGFENAGVFVYCPDCSTQSHLDAGGLIAQMAEDVEGALFKIGPIAINPGAAKALADSRERWSDFIRRHVRGDWGRIDEDDEHEDEDEATSVINGKNVELGRGNVLSAYRTTKGADIWVTTDLGPNPQTVVMLPDEY